MRRWEGDYRRSKTAGSAIAPYCEAGTWPAVQRESPTIRLGRDVEADADLSLRLVAVVKGDPRCLRNEARFQAIDVVISSVRSREDYRLSMSGGWWPHRDGCPFVSDRPILRVGEDIAALTPHRPERAQFAHSVLHSTGWLTIRSSGG